MRLIISALCAATLAGCWGDSQDAQGCTKAAAYAASQDEVKRRLKAPATAVFPEATEAGSGGTGQVIIARKGDCSFGISAHVDAQNGFGALIRTLYSGTFTLDKSTGIWRVEELHLAPQ